MTVFSKPGEVAVTVAQAGQVTHFTRPAEVAVSVAQPGEGGC